MLKYLLVIAVIGAVYFFFIKKKPIKDSTSSKDNEVSTNEMVECQKCGTYCSMDDTILSNGKYYCSPECAKES